MADEIEDDGPGPAGSYLSRATTTLQGSSTLRQNGPQNQPNPDRQNGTSGPSKSVIVQPKPQALPRRTGPASILVSPRQKGNSVLEKIKSMPWEYSDIAADYVVGATTCALFLSLKYHRLHPEYIYTRIRNLQGKYNLRVILTLVDIPNHEDSLKELSKTSVINNVTVVLCWSAAECARYLELFKTYENAAPTSIKQHQSTTYSDRLVDFVTTPRSINKTDAVSLVSQFGTLKTAVNASKDEVATIAGWGEKKVQQWCKTVQEPFRVQRAAKRGLNLENLVASQPTMSRESTRADSVDSPASNGSPAPSRPQTGTDDADRRPTSRLAEEATIVDDADDEEALAAVMAAESRPSPKPKPAPKSAPATTEAPKKRKPEDDPLSDGIQAALSKLRKS